MNITVAKFDPSVDVARHDETYEVPFKEHMTALEAMVYIHENCEDLAFDYYCRGRVCGRCAIMLDGEPCLACVAPLTDENHILEPLSGLPVVRDLVVDRHGLHGRLSAMRKRVKATSVTAEEALAPMDPGRYFKAESLEWCARCGVCNASCLALQATPGSFVGPAGMVAIASRYYDDLDGGDRVLQAVQEGLFNCLMCGKCDEVCSALEIDHLGIWAELRTEAQERGIAPQE